MLHKEKKNVFYTMSKTSDEKMNECTINIDL